MSTPSEQSSEVRKGWFCIDGQEGERTLEEQLKGLGPALAEAKGKTVLDLGCAEGLIALEFAKAGAASVYGIDYNEAMIATAKAQRATFPTLSGVVFRHKDMRDLIREERKIGRQFDIVLALAILHKLLDPVDGARFCCEAARSLIVIRLPHGSGGLIRAKHRQLETCDLRHEFPRHGFKLERKEEGPRGELVQYWRRLDESS